MKGNCCGARERDSVLMVTTDAETRFTTSAYEVRMAALVVAGGAAGAGRFTFSSRPQLLIEIKVIRSSSLLNIQMILKKWQPRVSAWNHSDGLSNCRASS
jgi:hypothetical protein